MEIVAKIKLPYYGNFDKVFSSKQEARNWVATMLRGARLGKRGEFGNVPRLKRSNHWWKILEVKEVGILAKIA